MSKVSRYFLGLMMASVATAGLSGLAAGCDDSGSNPNPPPSDGGSDSGSANLLEFLGVTPTAESTDYVQNKTQFQLHNLLTEQRHEKTWDLSVRAPQDAAAGLNMLFDVDEDVAKRLREFAGDMTLPKKLSDAMLTALLEKQKIFVYGTGATGRLAKQMESTFWRPFWRNVSQNHAAIMTKLRPALGDEDIEDRLVGEMTGADRALIASLEGFEDLQIIGRLQLNEHGIKKGAVVIEVTEGGETSAGIGAIREAHDQWKAAADYTDAKAAERLFFVYNNPDDRLLPFERSRVVIENPGITKVNLTTGPQAITGSTRMQATTIETFVIAHALQDAIGRFFKHLQQTQVLTAADVSALGFGGDVTLEKRLEGFGKLLAEVKTAIPSIAKLTELESETYRQSHFSTYFASRGLITVFIDGTERNPTFRLAALDDVNKTQRACWFQVWTPATDRRTAWQAFLGREFKGLTKSVYEEPFSTQIEDPYLKTAALNSLKNAGSEQQDLYDFSYSQANIDRTGPKADDVGMMIAVDDEAAKFDNADSDFRRFAKLFEDKGAKLGTVIVGKTAPTWRGTGPFVHVPLDDANDPLGVDQQIALKILLNAHSTAIMARLDKVVGNTMTNVNPGNLKLIGRATYLIKLHVDDVLKGQNWVQKRGAREPIGYAEANAILYDVMPFVKAKRDAGDQTASEVSLSIVRILESLKQKRSVTLDEALNLLKTGGGLNGYLVNIKAN